MPSHVILAVDGLANEVTIVAQGIDAHVPSGQVEAQVAPPQIAAGVQTTNVEASVADNAISASVEVSSAP